MKHLLKVNSITKSYRKSMSAFKFSKERTVALDEVSFSVVPGEILGVIGHNGAGKTTLFRILAGILDCDSGEMTFSNNKVCRSDYNQRSIVGYVPSDERSFFWRLTGRQNLRFFGGMYGLSNDWVDRQIIKKTKLLNLDIDVLFRDYSAGMRKKVALLRAFLHKPSLLIMDEITNSLDPASCDQVREAVQSYVSRGTPRAVLWSTHRLEEVDRICDKVLLLNKGKVEFFGKLEEYKKTYCSNSSYVIRTKAGIEDFHGFKNRVGTQIRIEKSNKGEYTDYIIKTIDQGLFGKAIHIAVKEYDAHIVFAGCLDKEVK